MYLSLPVIVSSGHNKLSGWLLLAHRVLSGFRRVTSYKVVHFLRIYHFRLYLSVTKLQTHSLHSRPWVSLTDGWGDQTRYAEEWVVIGNTRRTFYTCVYVYMYIYTQIHTHTHTYRGNTHVSLSPPLSLSIYIYMYIYVHTFMITRGYIYMYPYVIMKVWNPLFLEVQSYLIKKRKDAIKVITKDLWTLATFSSAEYRPGLI